MVSTEFYQKQLRLSVQQGDFARFCELSKSGDTSFCKEVLMGNLTVRIERNDGEFITPKIQNKWRNL